MCELKTVDNRWVDTRYSDGDHRHIQQAVKRQEVICSVLHTEENRVECNFI
jgi:hypothetical protein